MARALVLNQAIAVAAEQQIDIAIVVPIVSKDGRVVRDPVSARETTAHLQFTVPVFEDLGLGKCTIPISAKKVEPSQPSSCKHVGAPVAVEVDQLGSECDAAANRDAGNSAGSGEPLKVNANNVTSLKFRQGQPMRKNEPCGYEGKNIYVDAETSGIINLALQPGVVASQNTSYANGKYPAKNAIDGNMNTFNQERENRPQSGQQSHKIGSKKQWLWFIILWIGGLVAMFLLAGAARLLMSL